MRPLNITNGKKLDAVVAIEPTKSKSGIKRILPDGSSKQISKVLLSTVSMSEDELLKKYHGDLDALGKALIAGDPEVDIENTGKILGETQKIYLDKDNEVAYHVNFYKAKKNREGEELSREEYVKDKPNIAIKDAPIQWTGKKISRSTAIKKLVFSKKYQIKHVSGLTYEFLYGIAKELYESDCLMRVTGSSEKYLVLTSGGERYQGFLEGRINGEKYCLILHLANMELKGVEFEVI